ncbi:hypothetical protein BMF94_4053 [Rhodotorula taiwanensis]|uniref:Tetrapyrrole biosynthesis uroporphyrinogen III synthase domain-containing protein n=1 Tax=Rhodotorula taiwanensis TaxID=741276 RepID=A0A2S5B7Z2_9BASI|nr:hypothetical protein BMF94_4053 [Rhodotorula taiwanensis]
MESPRKRLRRHLILVRTPKDPLDSDPYHVASLQFAATRSGTSTLTLHHLPILETTYCNQDQLERAVEAVHAASGAEYDGVVLTSARSVQAYCAAQSALADARKTPLLPPSIPYFVVGHPTCTALRGAPCPPTEDRVLGADAGGTGERLAEYIVQHFQDHDERRVTSHNARNGSGERPRRPRLLYLTGDKNRDTIPRRLSDAGIDLVPLQVYSTCRCTDFERRLGQVLDRIRAPPDRDIQGEEAHAGATVEEVWFALFSPSGASECLAEMHKRGLFGDAAATSRIRFAAIGPVTEQFLLDQGLPVDAVASKPEPEALLSAVLQAGATDFLS